jgi:uncharacterized protein
MSPANIAIWFDIPVDDLDRAMRFYEQVIGSPLQRYSAPSIEGALFPERGVTGTLLKGEGFVPGTNGSVIYLDGGSDLSSMLERAGLAGGRVLLPKTEIEGDRGFFAYFLDSEGNRVGIHSTG